MESLYTTPEMEKVAGTPLPDDYKQWRSEVLKALVSQHSYIDPSQTKIVFQDVDPEEHTAWGFIIIGDKKAAVLFSIRPNQDTNNVELDPLDVMFADGSFQYLNEDSLHAAIDSQHAGRVYPETTQEEEYGNAPSENEYVGDMTGDVTPLEYSGYPAAYGGPRAMSMASCGALSRVVRDQTDVSQLFNLLSNYDGVNAAAEAVGLDDSLENLKSGVKPPHTGTNLVHVVQKEDGQLMVVFQDGESRSISITDIKEMFPEDFRNILRRVLGRGWAIIRDFPTVKSVEAPVLDTMPAPLEEGGWCRLVDTDGEKTNGVVAMRMMDFDGQTIRKQKAVTEDNEYTTGKALLGVRMSEDPDDHPMVGSDLTPGTTGCFCDESFTPTMTPNIKINHVSEMPDEPTLVSATRLDTGEEIGLVVSSGMTQPRKVDSRFQSDYDAIPNPCYYLPEHMLFLEVSPGEIELADKGKQNSIQNTDKRSETKLFKNANRYSLVGETEHGDIEFQHMDEVECRTKLARLGADDYAIEQCMEMGDQSEQTLYGLRVHDRFKVASADSPIEQLPDDVVQKHVTRLKEAANAAIEGANAVLNEQVGGKQEGTPDMQDNDSLNAILSLQFVSEETLDELVQSLPLFEEVEDRLAKMLMAARQGEDTIQEKPVQRALRGLGEAKNSLRMLAVELKSRE